MTELHVPVALTLPDEDRERRRGSQILNYAEVNRLLRSGYTQQEVAETQGTTQSAVAQARRRGMVTEGDSRIPRGSIPWDLRPQHRNLNVVKMLRCAARMREGMPVGESNQRATRQFVEGLREQDAVIHYDPDLAPYFHRVPRRHGIDHWLVRDPSLDDSGRLVRKRVT